MRRVLTIVLLGVVTAACSASKPSASEPGSSLSSSSTTPSATAPNESAPRFDVVLDDNGLTFPPGRTLAGSYLISFEDRRSSPPAGQHLHLQFLPSGPRILLIDVAAGTAGTHVLLANMVAEVVTLDAGDIPVPGEFVRPEALSRRHSIGAVPVTNPLAIEATPEHPTPVT